METKSMTKKKVLLALAATTVLAFGYVAPAYAEDPPPVADPGAATDVPVDPDSTGPGNASPDPATDAGTGAATDTDSGEQPQK
jgi:hypothetical protein